MFLFFWQFKPWRSYKGCSYKKKIARRTIVAKGYNFLACYCKYKKLSVRKPILNKSYWSTLVTLEMSLPTYFSWHFTLDLLLLTCHSWVVTFGLSFMTYHSCHVTLNVFLLTQYMSLRHSWHVDVGMSLPFGTILHHSIPFSTIWYH